MTMVCHVHLLVSPFLGRLPTWLRGKESVSSSLDPATVAQHTRVYRTTWEMRRVGTGVVRFGIDTVSREGALVEVTTAGLVVAGPPQPLTVRASTAISRRGFSWNGK